MTKYRKRLLYLLLKQIIFFIQKIAIYLSLGFYKGRPCYRRSLYHSKENIQHLKTWNFYILVGHFLPSWPIRIQINIPNRIRPTKMNANPFEKSALLTLFSLYFRCTRKHMVPNIAVTRVKDPKMQCYGSGMFISDPESEFFQSRIKKIPDQEPHQIILVF